MAASVRAGGWLLIEDFDPAMQPYGCPDAYGPEQALANKVRAGFRVLLAQRGADLEFGRRLPRLLRDAGLVDVAADAYMPLALAAGRELEKANVTQVRDGLIAGGHASAEEIEAHLSRAREGTTRCVDAAAHLGVGSAPIGPAGLDCGASRRPRPNWRSAPCDRIGQVRFSHATTRGRLGV